MGELDLQHCQRTEQGCQQAKSRLPIKSSPDKIDKKNRPQVKYPGQHPTDDIDLIVACHADPFTNIAHDYQRQGSVHVKSKTAVIRV